MIKYLCLIMMLLGLALNTACNFAILEQDSGSTLPAPEASEPLAAEPSLIADEAALAAADSQSSEQVAPEQELIAELVPMAEAEPEPQEEPFIPPDPVDNEEFVKINDYIPTIFVDLKYATTDNFTGEIIYQFEDAYLRYGTVEKLMAVQAKLQEQGLSLKIWDAFRPVAAQFKLWEVYPDATYVANPHNGGSSHSKGNTIDITLTDLDGNEQTMPTGFDDFSTLANRDYSDCSEEAAANARLLENIMAEYDFNGYWGEWWHYSDNDWYATDSEFNPIAQSAPENEGSENTF